MVSAYKKYKKYFIVILIAGLCIYIRSLSNGYNLDDELVTINHPLTNADAGVSLKAIFSSPYSIEKFGYTYGYRPMVHLSFALEHALLGESPGISHFVNLLIYLFTGVFLFYFLIKWLGTKYLFVFGLTVVIFMVHPLHVEVVASIKNRDELMAFLAAVIAINAYIGLIEKVRFRQIAVFYVFTAISLLSKKTAIPLFFIIPVLDVLYYKRWKFGSFLLFIPIVVASIIVGLDFDMKQALPYLAFVVPLTSATYFLFAYRSKITEHYIKKSGFYYLTQIGVSTVVLFVAYALNSYFLLILLVPFVLEIIKDNKSGSVIYLTTFLLAGIIFEAPVLFQLVVMGSFFLVNRKKEMWLKKNLLFLVLLLSALTFEVVMNVSQMLIIRQLILLLIAGLYLFEKPKLTGIIAFALFLVSIIGFGQVNLLSLFVALFVAIELLRQKDIQCTKLKFKVHTETLKVFWFVGIVCILFLAKFPIPSFQQHTKIEKEELIRLSNKVINANGIKEGRALEFVENPLVYPHFWHEQLATGIQTIGKYIQLELFPYPLRYYYGYKTTNINSFSELSTIVWLFVILTLIGLAIYFAKRNRIIFIGLVLMLVPLFFASNLVVLVSGMVAERHAYASTLGFSLLLAIGFHSFKLVNWKSIKQFKSASIVLMAILFLFTLQSFRRVGDWKSSITLMEKDKEACASSAHANSLLAVAYIKSATEDATLTTIERQQRIDQAIQQINKAINVFPYLFNYHFDLGRFFVLKSDYNSAFNAFIQAHELLPSHPMALEELVKCSFDLNRTNETLKYGELFINQVGPQEMTLELMSYQALTTQQFSAALKWASIGREKFPANQNFIRLIDDANAKKIISKNTVN